MLCLFANTNTSHVVWQYSTGMDCVVVLNYRDRDVSRGTHVNTSSNSRGTYVNTSSNLVGYRRSRHWIQFQIATVICMTMNDTYVILLFIMTQASVLDCLEWTHCIVCKLFMISVRHRYVETFTRDRHRVYLTPDVN